MVKRKLALFDIDGVIYEKHSIFDIIQDQERTGFINKGLWEEISHLLQNYKAGELNYKEAADKMLFLYSGYLQGKNYSEVLNYNRQFIKDNQSKLFPYFPKLIRKLKARYDFYLVTTNFNFTTQAFAEYFGVKGYLSSKIKRKGDLLQEGVSLSLGGNKGIVADLVARYGKPGSFAVGDSENDSDMLEKVENPFVIEPNEKLALIAKEKGWIMVDRNNITGIIMSYVGR